MSQKALKFENAIANKKECHASKKYITLNLLDIEKIIVSAKFKHSDKGFRYFIGFTYNNMNRPVCIILRQMSRYIKYFDNDGKKHVL